MQEKFATREGNDIVIRLPFERLEEILADAGPESMIDYPVTVRKVEQFLTELIASMNATNAVESMLTGEVEAMIEARTRSVKEHKPLRRYA